MAQVQKQTSRPMEQIKDLNISTHNFSHLMFDKDGKNIHWREEIISNKWHWEN